MAREERCSVILREVTRPDMLRRQLEELPSSLAALGRVERVNEGRAIGWRRLFSS